MLQNIGCEVLTANDGQQGVDLALSARPDIIFMDIRMPGMDGLDAFRRIKSELRSSKSEIKIVSLSASVFAHEQERYREAGFDDFIAKPFRFERICESLTTLLRVEFESVPTAAPVEQTKALSADELAAIVIPAGLWKQLSEAAERFSATRLEESFKQLEPRDDTGRKLASHLRRLSAAGDFDGIANALKIVKHEA